MPGMSDERSPLWPWIVALLIGLPVLYVASFGPACWLTDQEIVPAAVTHKVFGPLAWTAARCPDPIRYTLVDYCEIGKPERIFLGTGHCMILLQDFHLSRRPERWPTIVKLSP